LKVEVSGVKNGKKTRYTYHLLDHYDEKRRVTAMARTTAYSASIIAQLMLRKALKEKGVVPTERIGKNNVLFQLFWDELKKREIRIAEEKMAS
jgi:lysine 6-dehydrogenase